MGIEALSRGAPSAIFVEQDALALRALRDNIERLASLSGRVWSAPTRRAASTSWPARDARFAIAFLDPPYDSPRAEPALAALAGGAVLQAGAVVVLQHASKAPPPDAVGVLRVVRAKKFGETTLTFFRAAL